MQEQEIARPDENNDWRPVQYKDVDNIGPTLEWYVTEWFCQQKGAPACRGVQIKAFPNGGDLDVVAVVGYSLIMVECKGGAPSGVDDGQLDRFLLRAARLQPDIALLLFASDSKIDAKVKKLQDIYQNSEIYGPAGSERWVHDSVYVANVKNTSIATVLEATLSPPLGTYDHRPLHGLPSPCSLVASPPLGGNLGHALQPILEGIEGLRQEVRAGHQQQIRTSNSQESSFSPTQQPPGLPKHRPSLFVIVTLILLVLLLLGTGSIGHL